MGEIIDHQTGEILITETVRADYAKRINASWTKSFEGILDAGSLLIEAKATIPRGQFEDMVERDLCFSPSTARRLMAVATSERLRAYTHVLPTSWFTLYGLTTLSDDAFRLGIEQKIIKPDMQQGDLAKLKGLARIKDSQAAAITEEGCTVDSLGELIKAGKKYSVIYADPPWSFKVYSGKGKQRSADRHYDTKSLDDIKAMSEYVVPLAADDCALLMWAVMPELPGALSVVESWGFTYKTVAFTWIKQNKSGDGLFWGMGYWTRANAEVCLLATKGAPRRQAMDVHSVIMSPVSEHSRKPDEVQVRIERLLPGPYLELYGRRATPGWTVWGNQISRSLFHQSIPEFAA